MVEPTGYTALDLIGFTDKGPYDPTANYVRNDLVHVGNSTWRCKIDDTTGIAPTEGANWTIFIESATSLAGMSDVDLNTPKAGDGLVHNGNDWTNIPIMTKEQWKKNGAYNIAPNDITSQVLNGVTVVKNADESVTLNNTVVSPGFTLYAFNKIQIPNGTYKLVGCPSGASDNFRMTLLCNNNNTSKGNDTGSGLIFTYNASTDINLSLYLWVKTGYTCNNVVFKPMITTDLNATYADYVPHAMTNRELTESGMQTIYQVSTPAQQAANYSFPLSRSIKNAKKLIISYNYGATGYDYSRVVDIPTYRMAMLDTIVENAFSTVEVSTSSDYVKVVSNGSVNGVFFRKIDAIY